MSHAEIWDDSSLVDSWNDALEEYKKYHSIHARGERVEDILRSLDRQNESPGLNGTSEGDPPLEQPAHSESKPQGISTLIGRGQESQKHPVLENDSKQKNSSETSSPIGPAVPQHLVGSVQDEGLKNLLMSWYYAGYYTGLYEGQRR